MISGDTLKTVGEVLFGRHWRRDFEDRFNISNRTLRRMLANEHDIPAGLVADMEVCMRDHIYRADAVLEVLIAEGERRESGQD